MKSEARRRALEEELRAAREEEISRFGADVLAWLAVTPAWPEPVAARCGFPGDLRAIGPDLEGAGLAQHAEVSDVAGNTETHWWMPPVARRDVLSRLRRSKEAASLTSTASAIAARMREAREHLPPALVRWADLVGGERSADRKLRDEVTRLVAAGETGEALGWVEAARFAAEVMGGSLVTATALAGRQIELAYRAAHDRKRLATYLARPAQTAWISGLIEAPDDLWALHLLGAGGVGKTMLLRWVAAVLAPERKLVAVRIDFDHLSPDYPVRRPAQLLAALAGELRFHATEQRQVYGLDRLDEQLAALDETLSGELPPADALANVRRPEMELLLDLFADALRQFPAPALLVLDTCEELAKLDFAISDAPGAGARAVPPAVAATFEVLERLHKKMPEARVLFAGRRFLASKGHGWEAAGSKAAGSKAAGSEAEGVSVLPPRSYLSLQELRGFDEAEAEALLGEVFALKLSAERRDAVLKRSLEVSTSRVRRLDGSAAPEVLRYHPFDLALYAGWLQEDPAVDPAKLAGDEDPYVEMRILGRIADAEVRALVPSLVVLRRFDRAMAAAALGIGGAGERLTETLQKIGAQEWVDVQPDDEGDGIFYEVNRALWPRLWRFYSAGGRRSELDEAKRRIGPALEAVASRTPVAKLRAECVDAALRASRPAAGSALWADIEMRGAQEGAYERLRFIAERLLAEEGAAAVGPAVLWYVRATFLGVRSRLEPGSNQAWQWLSLLMAGPHTILGHDTLGWVANRVATRAYGSNDGRHPLAWPHPNDQTSELTIVFDLIEADTKPAEQEAGDPLRAFRQAQLRASLLAALEQILDRKRDESARAVSSRWSALHLQRWAEALASKGAPVDIVARARLLAARAFAMEGQWESADRLFEQAIAEADRADSMPRTPVIEGHGPPSLAVRARLEFASFDPLRSTSFVYDTKDPDPDGDRGRLLAHELLVELSHRWSPDGTRSFYGARPVVLEPDVLRPASAAARRLPPPFVAIARKWAATGRPATALKTLDVAVNVSLKSGAGAAAIKIAERERLRIVRRYRGAPPESGDVEGQREYLELAGKRPPAPEVFRPTPDLAQRDDRENVEAVARAVLRSGAPWSAEGDGPAWRQWLEGLPPRFVAELALEDGETLALHEPESGAVRLSHAHSLFKRVDDPLGMLFSSTLRLAAEARRGRDVAALCVLWFDEVKPAYEECQKLLKWPPLVQDASSAIVLVPDSLWMPWLERVFAWGARLDPAMVKMDLSAFKQRGAGLFPTEYPPESLERREAPKLFSLGALLDDESFATPAPTLAPAFEIAETEERPAPSGTMPDREAPRPPSKLDPLSAQQKQEKQLTEPRKTPPEMARPASSTPYMAAAGIAGIAGLMIGAGLLGASTTLGIIGIVGASFAAAALAFFVARSALGLKPADADERPPAKPDDAPDKKVAAADQTPAAKKEEARKTSPEKEAAPAEKKEEPATPTATREWARIEIKLVDSESVYLRLWLGKGEQYGGWLPLPKDTDPYERITAGSQDLRNALGAISPSGVELVIQEPSLAALAWEAIVPARKEEGAGADRRALRRGGATLRLYSLDIVLCASHLWSSLFTEVILNASHGDVHVMTSEDDEVPLTGLVCIVGRPGTTAAGPLMRVDLKEEVRQQKSSTSRNNEALLVAQRHHYFNAPVIVLVAEPVESLERGAAQRTQAAELRSVAHEVAQRAGVVLTIPALPSNVTSRALTLVAERFRREGTPERDALLDLAAEIRTLIVNATLEDAETQSETDGRAEAALDVVLYIGKDPLQAKENP